MSQSSLTEAAQQLRHLRQQLAMCCSIAAQTAQHQCMQLRFGSLQRW
jgi:hypothetical protein